jgi:LPS-assembly protein
MNNLYKGKAKNISAWWYLPLFVLLTYHLQSFATYNGTQYYHYQNIVDTPPPVVKPTEINNTNLKNKPKSTPTATFGEEKKKTIDSTYLHVTDTFTFKKSKDTLDAPIIYHADDSMVIDVPGEKMYLYGKVSSVKYSDNNLSAPEIEFDNKTSLVSAYLKKDSTGKAISYPYYESAEFKSVSDTIRFNMKNGRGLTKGTYTKQGDMFVYGRVIKKVDTSAFYAYKTRFTTCNLDTPHFAFVSNMAKFVNKKWAYTGPVHPEFEGVPIPISLPFGIFPLSQGRRSGLLAPSFTADAIRGLALENLGYYRIINQNWDVITRGTLYSYGSWNLSVNPRYYKRYHYQGSFSIDIQSLRPLDEAKSTTRRLTWTHSADTKARPGVTFSANVNISSTKFNQQRANSPQLNFQNQLGSTISYSKAWKNKPYSITINGNHSQNNVTKNTQLNLPDVAFTVSPQYPFKRKEQIGEIKWYENIAIGYNGSARSVTSFIDTAGKIGTQILDNLTYGAQHNIPITLSLPPLGVLQISPGVSYQESWFQQKLEQQYNNVTRKMDTVSLSKGLYTTRNISFNLGMSTRIFGMIGFKPSSRVKAIRHEVRPSFSLNYTPNINEKNYYSSRISPTERVSKSYFEGNRGGGTIYSNIRNGGMSFGIDNNVSMKIKSKADTSAASDKKITLIDGFSISSAYNFLQDSFQLSNIGMNARTNLFDKINISAQANFDPYQFDENGKRLKKLVWANKPLSLGNLLSAGISMQTSFKGGDKNKKTVTERLNERNTANAADIQGRDEEQRDANYIQNNPAEFADFEIPWSIDLSYSLTLSKMYQNGVLEKKISQGTTFNASANLTPRWKIGANGTYDITNKKLGQISMYLTRELHCWQMAINISQSDRNRFFSINISPKSSILRDLKINRTRSFNDL